MWTFARFLTLPLVVFGLVFAAAPGCGSDDAPDAFNAGGGKGDDDDDDDNNKICLLNNCDRDRDCTDCTGGNTTCDQSAHRCIGCGDAAGGAKCASGQSCTQYGNCVEKGVTCATDSNGVPTISCKNTADCGACSPSFRVCDTSAGKCVGCLPTNTTNCQSTDVCTNNTCMAKCPASCNVDTDCNNCGTTAAPAQACNKHICAACSSTKACPNGKTCDLDHGTCVAQCGTGTPGLSTTASCTSDANCTACAPPAAPDGGVAGKGTTSCDLPVNGGSGTCAVPATGCSQIASGGLLTLPAPVNKFTNLCSTNADCSNQDLDLNVGSILRDATGLDAIKDGNIGYTEHVCASVPIIGQTSCGVCVPCKVDTDCTDINIDQAAGQIFGPIGSIASSLLLDKAFGPNDHTVHMYCENVAGSYGVCLPCSNILARCAQTNAGVPATGTPAAAACAHDICAKGAALGVDCKKPSSCVADVCAKDPYCCTKEWDTQCITDVDLYCKDQTCTPDTCAYREAGWYCNSDPTKGGYQCAGDTKGSPAEVAGQQCATGARCTQASPGPKVHATLCDTETSGDTQCPIGSKGKPKCVGL